MYTDDESYSNKQEQTQIQQRLVINNKMIIICLFKRPAYALGATPLREGPRDEHSLLTPSTSLLNNFCFKILKFKLFYTQERGKKLPVKLPESHVVLAQWKNESLKKV